MQTYSIIIHGGCRGIEDWSELEDQHKAEQEIALSRIITRGWKMLVRGDAALDVVEKVAVMLEDDPAFNAGIGAAIGEDRQIELDASIMIGADLRCGAVAGVRGYQNPTSIARLVMEQTKHVMLIGQGAQDFAHKHGFEQTPTEAFYTPYQEFWWKKLGEERVDPSFRGTIGVVVRDKKGDIVAATSTGGMTRKMTGRVGDSPLIGSGTYADNRYGGASATGNGEQIIRTNLTRLALDLIRFRGLSAQAACEAAIKEMGVLPGGLGGIILIDKDGNVGAYGNEQFVPRAYMTSEQEKPVVAFEIA